MAQQIITCYTHPYFRDWERLYYSAVARSLWDCWPILHRDLDEFGQRCLVRSPVAGVTANEVILAVLTRGVTDAPYYGLDRALKEVLCFSRERIQAEATVSLLRITDL